ncbi:class I SAM-dependent methyltransferase [Roseibium sp. M-1]
MTQSPASGRSTEGMVDYNENSLAQRQNASRNSEVIADLARRVRALPVPLNITDYGCGPGQSAIETVRPALDVWADCDPSREVSVCHADQPGNDWNALMKLVFGKEGYMDRPHPPLVRTSVGSFYERLVPRSSVTLATCFAACHWLNGQVQINAPETLWFADLTGAARQQMQAQAEQDWKQFLRLRAEELRSGGYLLVASLGAVPEAGEINDTAASGRGIYRALQVVTAGMAADGLLDRQVADSFVFGLWFMTEDEARRPIEMDEGLNNAYDIDTIEVSPLLADGDLFACYAHDPKEYARRYTGYTRAFSCTTLRAHLFGPSAGPAHSAEDLETEFFRRFEALYEAETTRYAFEQWFLTVILRRR